MNPGAWLSDSCHTGQEVKEKLNNVRNRRFSYDGAQGSPRSASKEVCAVKEVRVLDCIIVHAGDIEAWCSRLDAEHSGYNGQLL